MESQFRYLNIKGGSVTSRDGTQTQKGDRMYINVQPVAYASRHGNSITVNRHQGQSQRPRQSAPRGKAAQVPAIPRSQAVKQLMEPSYSTLLQPERNIPLARFTKKAPAIARGVPPPPPPPLTHPPAAPSTAPFHAAHSQGELQQDAIYVNTNPPSVGSIYGPASSYSGAYSELEALRSSDSQGSTEEELASISQPGQMTYASNGPPSPVSSSYSELRQATRRMPASGYVFQPGQGHDGLYEPITPGVRAKTVAVGATLASPYAISNPMGNSAKTGNEPIGGDYFGLCSKCNMKIIGEGTGCTAMGRLYHIDCFSCSNCFCLLQGKPFYALDGKPFCEEDYLQTLEKCCKCLHPILDRILRATGKPYHPQCFTCVMCGKSLDGVPFTVDATNQIHCIEDFHKRFAPRCSVCQQPIMPEKGNEETVRVVALDRSFHVHCYKCEDCGLLLSSESEGRGCYPLDDHVLCKQCNTKRIQLLTQGI